VILFRSSNRNKRRGMHNIQVFYKHLQEHLAANSQLQGQPNPGAFLQSPLKEIKEKKAAARTVRASIQAAPHDKPKAKTKSSTRPVGNQTKQKKVAANNG
jgi:effector-binding domain-containing protein